MGIWYAQDGIFDEERRIKGNEKLVFLCLHRHANTKGQSFLSYRRIAEECGCCRRTAIRAIMKLVKFGLIMFKRQFRDDGRQTVNLYSLVKRVTPPVTHKSHNIKDIKTTKEYTQMSQEKRKMIQSILLS